ncbi:antitoxin MazE family protein [Bradyrhizobium guangdongense]|uniref:antitoxin MazE family protein n=1 Tax=Bradyrhizobium guangdongense TaxID=1325090 RepID=UPI001FEFA2E5|nr:antitoxin MazE family protein [Bradyrhizobium guangdongense]
MMTHDQLRAQGLRPVEHWVPDLRNPKIKARLRREAAAMARHPENSAVDGWIEAVYDWDSWR